MRRRHLASESAIVAMFCITAIFFFPAVQGPYAAVHGPVTALLSVRAKLKVSIGMVRAALQLLSPCVPAGRLAGQRGTHSRDFLAGLTGLSPASLSQMIALRC